MSEIGSDLELLSLDSVGAYYTELSERGVVSATLDETMQTAVVEAAYMAISAPIGKRQECGCVEVHTPFTSVITVQDRARLAVTNFAAQYDYLQQILSPDEYLRFVQSSGFIPALTAVGSLTAALEERGRMLRANREEFTSRVAAQQPTNNHHA